MLIADTAATSFILVAFVKMSSHLIQNEDKNCFFFKLTCWRVILPVQPYAIWNPDFRHTRSRYPTLLGHLGEFERS